MNVHAGLKRLLVPLALMALALILLIALPHRAAAQGGGSAILIWPVDPVIEADARAAALWLENAGSVPVTLQVRVFAWAQQDGQNVYADQSAVFATPPIATIAPGDKQLVRLTRIEPAEAGKEAAYRVIIDEIPVAKAAGESGASVSFRMRYSVPLFVYGEDIAAAGSKAAGKAARAAATGPILDWRIADDGESRFVEIRNRGRIHARITDAAFATGGEARKIAGGLLGYVLPGATMRWPLPPGAPAASTLLVSVNGAPAGPIEPRTE